MQTNDDYLDNIDLTELISELNRILEDSDEIDSYSINTKVNEASGGENE